MPGPEEGRLLQALDGTHPGSASGGADEWDACATLLAQVSTSLAAAQMPSQPGEAGAATSAAITESFHKSADAMSKRADKMLDGKQALTRASEAIKAANDAHTALGPEPGTPTYTPHADPNSPAGIKKHNAYLGDVAAYDAKREHREKISRQQADDLDTAFAKSSATMKEIHGIPDPPPPPQGYGGGSGGHGGGGGAKPPAHHTTAPTHTTDGGDDTGLVPHHPPTDTGTDNGTDDGPHISGPDDGGTSQGNVPPTTTGPVIGDPVSPTGSPGSTGLGLAGAAAGGVGGGMLGTGLATGGIRGGGLAPITTGGGAAASGVRGIGATSRSGVSGTLGRSGGMSSTASGTGTTSRGAGGARTGASAAGRGAGGRGGAGSRGAAGGRGAATGAGAGGRSGRSKDDEKKSRHGEFDDTEDWIDDEDAAPGIID